LEATERMHAVSATEGRIGAEQREDATLKCFEMKSFLVAGMCLVLDSKSN